MTEPAITKFRATDLSTPKGVEVSAVILASALSMSLGSAVMVGWLFDIRGLINLRPILPPMQFNTAFGFFLCGAGYLAIFFRSRLFARVFGAIAVALGALTLFQYVAGVNLGIDDFFLDQTPDPNRMAPNTALCFALVGAKIFIVEGRGIDKHALALRVLLSSVTLVLGLTAVTGYFTNIETAYAWGDLTRMALHTSSGFVMLGACGLVASLSTSYQAQAKHIFRWMPGAAAISIWVYSVLIWQALQAAHSKLSLPTNESSTYSVLSWFLLLSGLVLGVLFYMSLSRSAIAREEIQVRIKAENQLKNVIRELQLQKYALDRHSIVAITDLEGVITIVNDKFCDISGYARDELIGRTHRIINSGTHPKEFFVDLWQTIASGDTWHGVICNRAKDKTLYWVDTTIVPFSDPHGKLTHYVSIRTDVTAHKLAESKIQSYNQQLQERNAEMEQFVYTVSHDLKSPTVTIRGYVDFLQKDLEHQRLDRIDGFVNSIVCATEKMRNTIDDLLELSRVGRVTHEMSSVNLEEVISVVVNEMKHRFKEIDAVIEIDCDESDVWGDQVRLEQVLQNLLENAVKYGHVEDKNLHLRISTERCDDMIRLMVADNGPGIDPAFADRIFGLFERLQSNTEGTGIGLAIVKRIAEVHGGKAWVEPNKSGGSTFIISLPRNTVHNELEINIATGAHI